MISCFDKKIELISYIKLTLKKIMGLFIGKFNKVCIIRRQKEHSSLPYPLSLRLAVLPLRFWPSLPLLFQTLTLPNALNKRYLTADFMHIEYKLYL